MISFVGCTSAPVKEDVIKYKAKLDANQENQKKILNSFGFTNPIFVDWGHRTCPYNGEHAGGLHGQGFKALNSKSEPVEGTLCCISEGENCAVFF